MCKGSPPEEWRRSPSGCAARGDQPGQPGSWLLDEMLEAWRNRPLGEIVYLYLDARYEKVRMDGQIEMRLF